ncbi:DedA family protein [Tolumonas lignilytica]|jgi:Uncharacterized membrane-associated protein|uniref:DedA family protein n=1 Tax=Tolumonas lignilytica TaxID=1283284 RepID=UPI0004B1E476|nr:VTT domain-containing protein [Tolumonas lignilytica]
MISTWLFYWIMNDHAMTSVLAQNWLLGVLLIALIVFLETGLVFLPLLPGDSLLFTTGAFLGLSNISPVVPVIIIALASIGGDNLNYAIGRSRFGQFLLHRRWVKPEYIQKVHHFFDEYGGQAIIICRFIPVVRAGTPFVAGMTGMNPSRFFLFNAIGGVLWTSLFLLAGVWLGHNAWIKAHFSLLVFGIVVVSLLPAIWHFRRNFLSHDK